MVSSKNPVVIVSAKRSAIGSFCGSLSSIPAHEIGSQVIKDLIKQGQIFIVLGLLFIQVINI